MMFTHISCPNDLNMVEVLDSDSESELIGEPPNLRATHGRLRPLLLPTSSSLLPFCETECSVSVVATDTTTRASHFLERNPPSVFLKDKDLLKLKQAYGLPRSVLLRLPLVDERADNAGPGEIAVYEGYFASGFRGVVPSLVVEMAAFFDVCPSQFSPSVWETLMANQVCGEIFGVGIGVNEVLYGYFFRPIPRDEIRYMIHSRSKVIDDVRGL